MARRTDPPGSDAAPESSRARAQAVRALEGEFGELVTRFRRIIVESAHRVSPGLLPASYKVLTTIARCDGVTVSTLAERMLADKGQISRSVRELEQLGLVARTADPSDGRSSRLALTHEGERRLAAARLPHEGLLQEALRNWEVHDIENLTRLLHALTTDADPAERPEPDSA